MPSFFAKFKKFLCCGEEEDTPLLIGRPYGFQRVEVELAGLSEHERALINNRPVPVTYPIISDGNTAQLDWAGSDTRSLSNTIKSVTTSTMSTVGAKGSGYSALTNETSSMMQPLNFEAAESTEMRQLLPHSADGVKVNSSIDTVVAGCEEEEGGQSF